MASTRLLCLLLAFSLQVIAEEPWGKDADLTTVCHISNSHCPDNFLQKGAKAVIRFHQDVISPIDGPRSHFYPSSSQYAKEAIQKYGFFKGSLLGCDRLLRENDEEWVYKTYTTPDGRCLKSNPLP